ncbi:UDP-N-acetylglucosamine 1-carboxyvinyltransferase [Roseibium album]|uniref:UDP-N-acetylglucosamine 1-carboxyvinyltransferase n=1 Tax=Roseibium album TaxID=311410 RepID=UPI00391938EA
MENVQYIVEGGHKLSGEYIPSGNKNAALPIIAAALLCDEPVVLENVPRIRDVEVMLLLMQAVGAKTTWTNNNTLRIEANELKPKELDPDLCARVRASILLVGPLLVRWGHVTLAPPGGDVIGRRRLDTHFLVFEQLGVKIGLENNYTFSAKNLISSDIFLDEPSVTATENALCAAAGAEGTTILRNCASEPHVQDLANFLVSMGVDIEGIGTNVMTIHGGRRPLSGTNYRIGPDHIEVGSIIGLAASTKSKITIRNAGVQYLRSTLMNFERLGVECEISGDDLIVSENQSLKIMSDFGGYIPKIEDQPWPAFPADTMSIAIVTATQCDGVVLVFEKMFESRLFFVDKLIAMGARIVLCDPHRVIVIGPTKLKAAQIESPDIRAGMAMLIAAMCAKGTSTISNAQQIERGYEHISERLNEMGAKIIRVVTKSR